MTDLHQDDKELIEMMGNNGWISSKDKLPNHNDVFLVCTEDMHVQTAIYYPNFGFIRIGGLNEEFEAEALPYWQPLPKPPKENP